MEKSVLPGCHCEEYNDEAISLVGLSQQGTRDCRSFVTPDSDPGVAPASLPAASEQPARRPVLLDSWFRGNDDGRDVHPTVTEAEGLGFLC